ncbi:MAG TPA: tetratricopeptide repeat protein [Holophagaceae bacterium]|nr:tetratricopeptide repeat protein [Holophagaceae bacterium]
MIPRRAMLLCLPAALAASAHAQSATYGQAPSAFRADLEQGRYLKAYADAKARLAQDPNDAMALAAESQALSSFQRFTEGLVAAQKALDLRPGLPDALLARGLARAGNAVQQRNFSSLGQIGDAMDDLDAATKADGSLVTGWISLGLAYQQLPGILGGSTRKALACADGLRKVSPAKGDALQGMVLAMDEKWNGALPYFGRALSAAPGDPQIVAMYLQSLDDKPARKALGDAAWKQKLQWEAERLLPAVRTKARGVEAVAECLLDSDHAEEAWKAVSDGLAAVEAPSILRLELGKIAARANIHREEGLAALDQVVAQPLEGGTAGYPGAWWRKGQILQALGRNDEAKAAARKALTYDPKHPGARKLLESLG